MEKTQREVLCESRAEYAHRNGVLPYRCRRIEVDVVRQQGVAGFQTEIPARHGYVSADLRGGNLAERVLPSVVVGIEVLVVEIRFPEGGLEMRSQRQRALLGPSERIEIQPEVRSDRHVVDLGACKEIVSRRIPADVVPELSFGSGVDEGRVPDLVPVALGEGRVENAVGHDPASYSSIYLGDDGIVRPRLQPEEDPVLQLHHPHGVVRSRRIVEEILVEGPSGLVVQGYVVVIHSPEYGQFRTVSDEG